MESLPIEQLKNNIIDKINLLKDQAVVEALGQIVDKLNSSKTYDLSASEKELVELGLRDFKEDRVVYDSKLREDEDKWLNE